MYAVFKGKTYSFVNYVGMDDPDIYPDWFREYVIKDFSWYYGNDVYMYELNEDFPGAVMATERWLRPYKSTVLFEHQNWDPELMGEYVITLTENFNSMFTMLTLNTAALKDNVVECYFWDADKPLPPKPKWMEWLIIGGDIYGKKVAPGTYVTTFNSSDGEIAMSPQCVFIKSKYGDVKYLEPDTFNKFFDTFEGVEAI